MTPQVNKILVAGLGLIGGSLARSLKQTGFAAHVSAYGYRDVSLKKGLEQGVIDSYSLDLDEALDGADIVVIGTPTLIAAELYTPKHFFVMAICAVLTVQRVQSFDWVDRPSWTKSLLLLLVFMFSIGQMFTQAFNPFLYFQF